MHFGWGICCKSYHIKPHSCSLPQETLAYIFLLFTITIILIEVSLGGRPKINFALLKWSHLARMLFWWLYPCLDWLNCVKIPQGHRLVSTEELQGRRKHNCKNPSARQAGRLSAPQVKRCFHLFSNPHFLCSWFWLHRGRKGEGRQLKASSVTLSNLTLPLKLTNNMSLHSAFNIALH